MEPVAGATNYQVWAQLDHGRSPSVAIDAGERFVDAPLTPATTYVL